MKYNPKTQIFVNYLPKKLDLKRIEPVKNTKKFSYMNKPETGGIWASGWYNDGNIFDDPYRYSWEAWCMFDEQNDYQDMQIENRTLFKLKPSARVMIIDTIEDLKRLISEGFVIHYLNLDRCNIDFEKLAKQYDALWVTRNAIRTLRYPVEPIKMDISAWTCETLFVMNKKVVQLMK